MNRDEAVNEINAAFGVLGYVQRRYSNQFTPETCPLKDSNEYGTHDALSQVFTGIGCWTWNCPFCGENFEN